MRAHGKTAYMALEIRRRIASGDRIIVATLTGTVDGAQWLADHERNRPRKEP